MFQEEFFAAESLEFYTFPPRWALSRDSAGRLTGEKAAEMFPSLLCPVGGALACYDLVDALSEAAVGGQPPRRLPQFFHAAVVGVGHGERLGVFHWNRRKEKKLQNICCFDCD